MVSYFAFVATLACSFAVEPTAAANVADQVLPKTDTQFITLAKCAFVTFGQFTYEDAKAACFARNATLGFFMSPSEEHAVRKHIDWNSVPGFQRGSTWVGQLWLGIRRSMGTWVWDNPIMPNMPVPFTAWGSGVTGTSATSANCVLSREDGWTPFDCEGNSAGGKYLAGALCTAVSRFEPYDSNVATSDNYCGAFLTPPSSNSLSLPMVIKKQYFFIKGTFNYTQAVTACNMQKAQLSTARSPEEFKFITYNLRFSDVNNAAWFGLKRSAPGSDQFQWIDMMPNTHMAPFLPNQPDQSGDCAAYGVDFMNRVGWRTAPCSNTMNAICETFAIP